jgi:hypothetical protein
MFCLMNHNRGGFFWPPGVGTTNPILNPAQACPPHEKPRISILHSRRDEDGNTQTNQLNEWYHIQKYVPWRSFPIPFNAIISLPPFISAYP